MIPHLQLFLNTTGVAALAAWVAWIHTHDPLMTSFAPVPILFIGLGFSITMTHTLRECNRLVHSVSRVEVVGEPE